MKEVHFHHTYHQERVSRGIDRVLISRLFRYLKPHRMLLTLAIMMMVVSKGIEAYIPLGIGHIAQYILESISLSDPAKEQEWHKVLVHCLGIALLLLTSYFLDSIVVFIKGWIGQRGIYSLRRDIYQRIIGMPIQYYDRHPVGSLVSRTIHDVDQIDQMFSDGVVPLIGNIVLFVGITIGVMTLSWQITVVSLIMIPSIAWLTNNFRKNQRSSYARIRAIVASMNTFVEEHLMGASTIRHFGLEEKERKRFEEMNEDHCNAYVETGEHFAFFSAGIDFLQNLSLIGVFAILMGGALATGTFQAGTYFTFSLYALMIFRPLADLAERYNSLQSAMAASERIFDVLDRPIEPALTIKGIELHTIEKIEFDNVWFAYENENWILKGVTFQANKGESLAIVGVTGAGKTSIMNVLLRFYPIQKGSIKINGIDIHNYSITSLRKQFGLVLQDPVIFSGTVADNIALFSTSVSEQTIERAVDYVNLREFIQYYPKGIHEIIGERGKTISMGEMQLISLARAVAQNRSVLILDEATANIDTGTERMIQLALEKIMKEKTALVIAHRLSTIKDASRILVIHQGVVAESGTHQELLQRGGTYEKLYRLQFF